jgi:NTE family protein
MQQEKRIVVYFIRSTDSVFASIALEEVSIINFIVNKKLVSKDYYASVVDTISKRKELASVRKELIIVEEKSDQKLVDPNINLADFNLYHRVSLDDETSCRRCMRFMAGKATGLVLSSGGTRAWAHIGALKAISELKIPVDIIGGVGTGALIGALYAMGLTHDEINKQFAMFVSSSRKMLSWRNLTLPIVSVFDGKSITLALQKLFDNLDITNLNLPYFCISCNISTNQLAIHQYGNLFERIRASVSLPLLIPPIVINGNIHVEGSIVNNMPADIMKNILGCHSDKIIAFALAQLTKDKRSYKYPQVFTFTNSLLYKLGLSRWKYLVPSYGEGFIRTVTFSGNYLWSANAAFADVLVDFNLGDELMLDAKKGYSDRLINIGYAKALQVLQEQYK